MYIVNSCSYRLVTGRNEVLAKVIFSQASVCPRGGIPACLASQSWGVGSGPRGSGPRGGVWSWGSPIFWGAVKGDPPILGGEFFFDFCFLWGYTVPPGTRHRNTVNVRPVRILLECILVLYCIAFSRWRSLHIKVIQDQIAQFNADSAHSTGLLVYYLITIK